MTYGEAGFTVFACVALAVLLSFAVHGLVPVAKRARHQEVGTTIFLQLGVLFAVLLAFVYSEAIGQYDEARQAVDQERAALHGAAMLAVTLAPDQAKDILSLD